MSRYEEERLDVNTNIQSEYFRLLLQVVKDPEHVSSAHINSKSHQVSTVAVLRGQLILLNLVV